ncbi:Transcription initiation factor TFIID subunit 5 [Thelohanellus kitauei]|uniref:Transcription initiation factor TFIID subunit 5 n=1 Tax=Thelohanellus kitauei TaxID=669202 RepID=A0A0C2MFS3_THEKT|nr:Transcription initiation factor TFIID subunit 5 [Thelohanellus kitauei]
MMCPDPNRIPYPVFSEFENSFSLTQMSEAQNAERLANKLPSACIYTFLNSRNKVNNAVFTPDSSILAAGLADSTIKVWSLTYSKIKQLKQVEELQKIDKFAYEFHEKILTEKNATFNYVLSGHSGPVFGLSLGAFNNTLLSSGIDSEIRLWNLTTRSCMCVFKSHSSTVWDIDFCPKANYFVSAGRDQSALLWNVQRSGPLRVFVGHYSDVYCCLFHPNSNYLATGSVDRTVRIWDTLSGSCVRLFTGFKAEIRSLCFSPDGRFLIVGDQGGSVYLHDISDGQRLCAFSPHNGAVTSIRISRDFEVMATGGLDSCVKIYNLRNSMLSYIDSQVKESIDRVQTPTATYFTKKTPIYSLNFNLKNVLTCCGEFRPK